MSALLADEPPVASLNTTPAARRLFKRDEDAGPARKVLYRLYPNATERQALDDMHALHCRVYNALLEEHKRHHEVWLEQRRAWAQALITASTDPRGPLPPVPEAPVRTSFNFSVMCQSITGWRELSDALGTLNAQSLQVTARRANLAFDAFFRRVKAGEVAGYPRFKSRNRFSGWGYKTHGDGWKLLREERLYRKGKCAGWSYGAVRLSGVGTVSMRGMGRFPGTPKTAEVVRKGDRWYLSVTFDVAKEDLARDGGNESAAFDWGIETLLTLVTGDPMTGQVETVENPRWLKKQLTRIRDLQRAISRLEEASKKESGREKGFPCHS